MASVRRLKGGAPALQAMPLKNSWWLYTAPAALFSLFSWAAGRLKSSDTSWRRLRSVSRWRTTSRFSS